MKKVLLAVLGISFSILAVAQKKDATDTTGTHKAAPLHIDLANRPADHIMIQYGYDAWTNRPDSVRTGGFSRHFNIYFMFDKPFKTNPKMSVAFGIGLGSSNIFFEKTGADVKSNTIRMPFPNLDSANHFDKYKLVSMYGEVPVELRWFSNPENPNNSWKVAVGMKIGLLVKAYTKGKNYENKYGASIYGPSYILKEQDKRFINNTMLAATARVGFGFVSVDGGYQFNGVLKDGAGAAMNKWSIGLTISGL
jgi:hypothetical protein